MNISSIVSNLIGQSQISQSTQQAASSGSDLVAAAFKKASSRLDQEVGSTRVQLSAFGQIQGAFSEVQTTGNALSETKQTVSASKLKTAVADFVAAFNKANKAIASATKGSGAQVAALANNTRATFAGNDLQHSLSTGNNLSELSKLGVTQNQDGSLALDTKALDKAVASNQEQVRSIAAGIGGQVAKTAASELASSGNVGSSVNTLSNRSRNQAAQQTDQQDQFAAAQRLIDQQSARLNSVYSGANSVYSGALSTYQRTFTG